MERRNRLSQILASLLIVVHLLVFYVPWAYRSQTEMYLEVLYVALLCLVPFLPMSAWYLIRSGHRPYKRSGLVILLVPIFVIADAASYQKFGPSESSNVHYCSKNLRNALALIKSFESRYHRYPTDISELGKFDMAGVLALHPSRGSHDDFNSWTEDNYLTEFDKHFEFIGFPAQNLLAVPVLRERIVFHEGINILFSSDRVDFYDMDAIFDFPPHTITFDAAELESLTAQDRRAYFEARGE